MKVIINIGISGSGKSTWTADFLQQNLNFIRINRDDIRKTCVGNLNGYYQRKDFNLLEKKVISQIEAEIFTLGISCGKSIIIDNTNLKQSYINIWIKMCEFYKIPIEFKLFDCELNVAKNRVIRRDFYQKYEEQIELDKKERTIFGELDLSKFSEVDYVNKQYENYIKIKEFILNNYKTQII